MKKIGYSLFTPTDLPKHSEFVFGKYLLGVYFNARMNNLLYPGWQTVVYVEDQIFERHRAYFTELTDSLELNTAWVVRAANRPLWGLVLSRLEPLFDGTTTHLACRDLDSIATYREAQAVQEWLTSGFACHAMADNVYHLDPLMAGMCGFDVKQFRGLFPEYNSFDGLLDGFDLRGRGADQALLRERVWPRLRKRTLMHSLKGHPRVDAAVVKTDIAPKTLPGVRPELWESNLVVAFMGQAGVNEMELLRFFQRHDEHQKFYDFEDEHSDICYWRR